jgi:soluble lytic murein transglycosylase-like protein
MYLTKFIPLLMFSQVVFSLPFNNCFKTASLKYGVEANIIRAVAVTESGMKANARGPLNSDGTYDIGLMQINSSWLDKLSVWGISEQMLFDPCVNVDVGTWILSDNIKRYGKTWNAVGIYNVGTRKDAKGVRLKMEYINRVFSNYSGIVGMHSAP